MVTDRTPDPNPNAQSNRGSRRYSSFREAKDGADTIVWLLAQKGIETGRFWFDREVAAEHQWLAATHTDEATQQALWAYAQKQADLP